MVNQLIRAVAEGRVRGGDDSVAPADAHELAMRHERVRLHLVHRGLDPCVFTNGFHDGNRRVAQPERDYFPAVHQRLHLTPAFVNRVGAADGPLDGQEVQLVDAELLEHRVARGSRVRHLGRRDLRADKDAGAAVLGDGGAGVDEVLIG